MFYFFIVLLAQISRKMGRIIWLKVDIKWNKKYLLGYPIRITGNVIKKKEWVS